MNMQSDVPISQVLFYFWKVLGLCPFYLDKTEIIKRSKLGTLYTALLVMISTANFGRVVLSRLTIKLPYETTLIPQIDFSGLILEYIVNTTIWIYAIVYQDDLRQILKCFRNIIDTAISLGMPEIYGKIFRQIHFIIFMIDLCFIIVLVFDFSYNQSEIMNDDISIWLPFNSVRCLSVNIVVIYVFSLNLVKSIFQFINNSLSILPEMRIARNFRKGAKKVRLSRCEVDIRLNELGQLHSDLKNLVKMLSELFSLPILIAFLMQFSQSIVNMYTIFIFIKMYQSWKYPIGIILIIGWLALRLIQIFSLVDICDSTCQEANRMAIVLHELWASKRPEGFKDMLKNLSIRLLQQPMEINFYNSLNLNHQLIQKMCGILTTYLIILIQVDKSDYLEANRRINSPNI